MTIADSQTSDSIGLYTIGIGRYANSKFESLNVSAQIGRLIDLLANFGIKHYPWAQPDGSRGAGAVEQRLQEWVESGRSSPSNSILYWVGHGWSDGIHASLAHADSPTRVGESGVTPEHLADVIRTRQALAAASWDKEGQPGWAFVIIDACRSKRFVELLVSSLKSYEPPQRVLIVGVSGNGATTLGRFTDALHIALATTYKANGRISLLDLSSQFYRLLPGCEICPLGDLTDAALVPMFPPAAWMAAPLDTLRHLEDVVQELSPDERRHFLIKAQGAEHGELSWFFEGRDEERVQIAEWLRSSISGILVVTGPPGSGKSALLGNIFVHSLPQLRDALARRGLISPVHSLAVPPENVFDVVIHLSGASLFKAAARIAEAAGLPTVSARFSGDVTLASDLDWLVDGLTQRSRPFTVLADALDEALDPLGIARSLLKRIATVGSVRVVVGTRPSTSDEPDVAAADADLLDVFEPDSPHEVELDRVSEAAHRLEASASESHLIWVRREPDAIYRYVQRRLTAARDQGYSVLTTTERSVVVDWQDSDIERAAVSISRHDKEFLYARLAVYEILADPRLLTPGRSWSLETFLRGDHRDLFASAVRRLSAIDDRYPLLMNALALAHGRGVPEADGMWTAIATALAGIRARMSGVQSEAETTEFNADWADVIHGLLDSAAAYIVVDTPDERTVGRSSTQDRGRETVYRLAHRTFVEFFTSRVDLGQLSDRRHAVAARLLAEAARHTRADIPQYLARHLSGHIAEADMWDRLGEQTTVLDLLEPRAVTVDAVRHLFGRRAIPPAVAAITAEQEVLSQAAPWDKPGLRHLSMIKYSDLAVINERSAEWGIAAAAVERSNLNVQLRGHTAAVNRVRGFVSASGRVLIASASDDSTIRLWDPYTATPVGSPLVGHAGSVEDVSVLNLPDGRICIASAGADGTVRLWDPERGIQLGAPFNGHVGRVWCVFVVPRVGAYGKGGDATLLASGDDEAVRIWDPVTGHSVGYPLQGHAGGVWSGCSLPNARGQPGPYGLAAMATGGQDGSIRIWEADGQSRTILNAHLGGVRAMCTLPGLVVSSDLSSDDVLATAGDDGAIKLWDPISLRQIGRTLTGHGSRIWDISAVAYWIKQGKTDVVSPVLATAGHDGSVRIWDPSAGRQVGVPITGHVGRVVGLCDLPMQVPSTDAAGPRLLATAGQDRTIRIWTPFDQPRASGLVETHVGRLRGLCELPARDAPSGDQVDSLLAAAGDDGTIRIWDPSTGRQRGRRLEGHKGRVVGLVRLPSLHSSTADRRDLLASCGQDGLVRIWDPVDGLQIGDPLVGHVGRIWAICAFPNWNHADDQSERTLLATAGDDGSVRIWDPALNCQVGEPLLGHNGRVRGLCAFPVWDETNQLESPYRLATTGEDGSVRIWDPVRGEEVRSPLLGHAGRALGLCILPRWSSSGQSTQGTLLATTGEDGTLRVWDPRSGMPLGGPLLGHTGGVWAVCPVAGWDANGKPNQRTFLATAGEDGAVCIWDPFVGRRVGQPIGGEIGATLAICTLAAAESTGHSEGQALLATAGEDGSIRIWDPRTGRAIGHPLSERSTAIDMVRQRSVRSDSHVLSSDGVVSAWSPTHASVTAAPIRTRISSIETINGREDLLAIGNDDGFVALADPDRGIFVSEPVKLDTGAILALRSEPVSEARVAAAGRSGDIAIIVNGRLSRTISAHDCPIRDLCWLGKMDTEPLLASAGNDGTIKIWSLDTYRQHGETLVGHQGWIWSLAVLPGSEATRPRLVSAGADHTVRLWDPYACQQLGRPLTGHTDQVRAVTSLASLDGFHLLVSGAHDGTVRLWDSASRRQLRVLPIGRPVHAIVECPPDDASLHRTDRGRTVTLGLRNGVMALDINRALFPRAP